MGTIQRSALTLVRSDAESRSLGQRIKLAASAVLELALVWQDRSEQRRALAALTDHQLKDIGLSRADAVRETMKRFWQE